jgi:hypothetical protein
MKKVTDEVNLFSNSILNSHENGLPDDGFNHLTDVGFWKCLVCEKTPKIYIDL